MTRIAIVLLVALGGAGPRYAGRPGGGGAALAGGLPSFHGLRPGWSGGTGSCPTATVVWVTAACASHDACYAAQFGRSYCDARFRNDLQAHCAARI